MGDREATPFSAKEQYYDQELVALIVSCVGAAKGGRELGDCVVASLPAAPTPEQRKRWAAPPPSGRPWSMVQERAFTADPQLRSLRPKGSLWPFDFRLRQVFESPPRLSGLSADSMRAYIDPEPWDFPLLRTRIQSDVARGIGRDPRAAETFEAVQEFTQLQRIFRLALEGRFGDGFQGATLVRLARETRPDVQRERTARWLERTR